MAQDTRKDPRAKVLSMTVRYKSATVDQFIEQHSHDVSRGGIYIKTTTPFPPGTLLKFEIRIQDEQSVLAGVGRVVWKRETPEAGGEMPAGMGVKFIKIEERSKDLISRLVEQHAGKPSAFESGSSDARKGEENAPIPVPVAAPEAKVEEKKDPNKRASTMLGLGAIGREAAKPEEKKEEKKDDAFFPKSEAPPPERPAEERTVMKQAAELLQQALSEAGGSLSDIAGDANSVVEGKSKEKPPAKIDLEKEELDNASAEKPSAEEAKPAVKKVVEEEPEADRIKQGGPAKKEEPVKVEAKPTPKEEPKPKPEAKAEPKTTSTRPPAAAAKTAVAHPRDEDEEGGGSGKIIVGALIAVALGVVVYFGFIKDSDNPATNNSASPSGKAVASGSTAKPKQSAVAVNSAPPKVSAEPPKPVVPTRVLPSKVEIPVPAGSAEEKLLALLADDSAKVDDKGPWFDLEQVKFDAGKGTLTADSEAQLKSLAEIVKAYPDLEIKVAANDAKGELKAVGAERATATSKKLVALGAEEKRVSTDPVRAVAGSDVSVRVSKKPKGDKPDAATSASAKPATPPPANPPANPPPANPPPANPPPANPPPANPPPANPPPANPPPTPHPPAPKPPGGDDPYGGL